MSFTQSVYYPVKTFILALKIHVSLYGDEIVFLRDLRIYRHVFRRSAVNCRRRNFQMSRIKACKKYYSSAFVAFPHISNITFFVEIPTFFSIPQFVKKMFTVIFFPHFVQLLKAISFPRSWSLIRNTYLLMDILFKIFNSCELVISPWQQMRGWHFCHNFRPQTKN